MTFLSERPLVEGKALSSLCAVVLTFSGMYRRDAWEVFCSNPMLD